VGFTFGAALVLVLVAAITLTRAGLAVMGRPVDAAGRRVHRTVFRDIMDLRGIGPRRHR
jgi:hypothetical protein